MAPRDDEPTIEISTIKSESGALLGWIEKRAMCYVAVGYPRGGRAICVTFEGALEALRRM